LPCRSSEASVDVRLDDVESVKGIEDACLSLEGSCPSCVDWREEEEQLRFGLERLEVRSLFPPSLVFYDLFSKQVLTLNDLLPLSCADSCRPGLRSQTRRTVLGPFRSCPLLALSIFPLGSPSHPLSFFSCLFWSLRRCRRPTLPWPFPFRRRLPILSFNALALRDLPSPIRPLPIRFPLSAYS
jgi:hypothetical protein